VLFGIVSDPHVAPPDAEPYIWHNQLELSRSIELLETALEWLRGQQIDTLALLGDLTEAADAESFAVVRDRARSLNVPVIAVPGNCDVDSHDRSLTAFERMAEDGLSVAPASLLMEDGSAVELVGLAREPGSKRLTGVRATSHSARVRTILTHYPILDLESELIEAGFKHSGNLTNRAEIEASLRASGAPKVVIHGHLHIHDARISGNLLHLSCGALIEPPHQVSTIDLSIDGGSITVERQAHSVRTGDVERLPVFAPGHARWVWSDGMWREQ